MSVLSQKNVITTLIGKDNTQIATGSVQITDSGTAGTFIADGQIVVLGSDGNVLAPGSTVSDSPWIQIVAREGATASTAKLNYSAKIYGADIKSASYKAYVAPVEQITFIGYNGSTGSIDNTGTDYVLTMVNDWDDQMWSKQKNRLAFDYTSTSATQLSIAKSFSATMNYDNFKSLLDGVAGWYKVEMFSDGTTANSSGTPTLTLVNGSDVVTLSVADANTQTVGALVRLGSVAATTTSPVYEVIATSSTDTSLSALQVRLHTYYQGTSGTVVHGTSSDVVTGSTNYGLKITGKALDWGIPPYSDFKFKKAKFHVELKGFGATTKADPSTAPTKGTGSGFEVAEWEYFAMGNEGALNRTVIPLPNGRTAASSSSNYDTISIESADRSRTSPITATVPMGVQTFLFTINGGTNTATILTNLRAQLNPYLNSVNINSI